MNATKSATITITNTFHGTSTALMAGRYGVVIRACEIRAFYYAIHAPISAREALRLAREHVTPAPARHFKQRSTRFSMASA